MNAILIAEVRDQLLSDIARDINHQHDELVAQAGSMFDRARHLGDLLLTARKQVGHGQWLPWLRLKCPCISETTARNYMRVAKCCAEHPDVADNLGLLTFREILSALATRKTATVADLYDAAPRPLRPDQIWPAPVSAAADPTPGANGAAAEVTYTPITPIKVTETLLPLARIVSHSADDDMTIDDALKVLPRQCVARLSYAAALRRFRYAERQLKTAEALAIKDAKSAARRSRREALKAPGRQGPRA